jgi:hypothetical protein
MSAAPRAARLTLDWPNRAISAAFRSEPQHEALCAARPRRRDIEREAEGIRAALATFGRWDGTPEAKRDHDEMLRIAAQLRQTRHSMLPSSRGYSTRQTPHLTFDRRHIGPIITAHAQGPTQIASELDASGFPLGSVNREVPRVLFPAGPTDGFDACRQRTRFRAERIVVTRSLERFVIHVRVFGKYFTNFTGSWQ